jgi:hypothetical protein
VIDSWIASYNLDPDELDAIKEVLKLGFAALASVASGTDIAPKRFEPRRKVIEKPVTTKEQIAQVKAMRGNIGRWRTSATS